MTNNYGSGYPGYGGYGYPAAPVAGAMIVGGTAAMVGAAATSAGAAAVTAAPPPPAQVTAVNTLPCGAAPVEFGGAAYYQCGSTWFTRAYIGGSVAYVEAAPPG